MKVAWATDIHFNFIDEERAELFCQDVAKSGAERLWIGGDIAESSDFVGWLRFLEERLDCHIDFVLGNHDYYRSDIQKVRKKAKDCEASCEKLTWLPGKVIPLTQRAALIGHGGWGDGRCGDLEHSVFLNDFRLIGELFQSMLDGWAGLGKELAGLGDDAAATLGASLLMALQEFDEIFVLTHVPPFKESARYKGNICGDDWLPHMVCKALGDMLRATMERFPGKRMTVLSGHTHGFADEEISPNIHAMTGEAEYRNPVIQRYFEIA